MNTLMIFFLLSGIILSIYVYFDTRKYKQPMQIMGAVWPLTMLWASWIGLAAYLWFGRAKDKMEPMGMEDMDMNSGSKKMEDMDMSQMGKKKPKWQGVALSTLHCGAGCTLADIIGTSIAGILVFSLAVEWSFDFILALAIGVYFQYMAIQQMGRMKPGAAIRRALKSDILSLSAWQVGMYGFMAIYIFVLSDGHVSKLSSEFWFAMQIAMLAGFIIAYPMNILLIKIGLKHAM